MFEQYYAKNYSIRTVILRSCAAFPSRIRTLILHSSDFGFKFIVEPLLVDVSFQNPDKRQNVAQKLTCYLQKQVAVLLIYR